MRSRCAKSPCASEPLLPVTGHERNTMAKSNRHFYRCRSCCHVIAVEGTLETEVTEHGANIKVRCVCDGKLELMGRVSRKPGLVLDSERCACDARCTNAPGPCCECQCGGENHGTGRVVPIEIDAGGVPRLVAEDATECRRRAEEYARHGASPRPLASHARAPCG